MKNLEYDADSIHTLTYPDNVRAKPDMYVGSTSGKHSPALARCLREIIDNSLDEYLIGVNKLLYVHVDTKTGEVVIVDNGRGVPTEVNTKTGKSALTMVYGELHSSGKFNRDSYSISSGKNGVGASCTNALSERFQAWSNNNKAGTWITQEFKHGIPVGGATVKPPQKEYKSLISKHGTIVSFVPDVEIFKDGIETDVRRLTAELDDIQYLCPGLRIRLVIDDEEKEFYSEKGIVELVQTKLGSSDIFQSCTPNCDVAINFTRQEGYSFKSYVNLCFTDMGGKHLDGLRTAICDLFKEKSKLKIQAEDILEGVRGAIHYRMAEPQYQSQTKNELTSVSARQDVIDTVKPQLAKWFRKNKEVFDRILKYSEEMFTKKQKLKADKDLLKGVSKLNNAAKFISDKFQDADRRKYRNPADLEMFVVEGDSAGGHFKYAREGFQAALKLRGKVINAAKQDAVKLFGSSNAKDNEKGNREIRDLVAALGCGIQDSYDETKLRFGKLILLTDSDVDGSHISNLILAFLMKYIPQLIKNGHVYVIDAPLFIANSASYRSYGKTRNEVDMDMKEHGISKYTVMRAKGWGECSAEQLGEICLNPKTRKLLRVEWDSTAEEMLEKTMGNDTDFRKELLGIE